MRQDLRPGESRVQMLKAASATKPHGTRARYNGAKCRCAECRAANNSYEKRASVLRQTGRGNPIVPALSVRDHILKLGKAGVGYKTVADAAHVATSIVFGIRSGVRKHLRKKTEEKLLVVTKECAADHALVKATATWVLLDELIGRGYSKTQLATWIAGKTTRALQVQRSMVTVRMANAVRSMHDKLRRGQLARPGPGVRMDHESAWRNPRAAMTHAERADH